ncbi:MAG: DEAD/DEAH box helicase [Sphaerochaetaceae bacterium]|nr:DEAD/DEAH box helicase [Sphaerochaetaceae bacterium]
MESFNGIDDELTNGFTTAFVDQNNKSNSGYRSEFVSNDPDRGRKVLTTLSQELESCDEFKISVAFITKSGITPLLQTFKELESKNIPGEILTTNYLNFSEPDALDKLSSLKNIKLKMYQTNDNSGGFHTKGYIFKKKDLYHIIIGSSNLTLNAITVNKEWNTKLVSKASGEIPKRVLKEYGSLWDNPNTFDYELIEENYRKQFLNEITRRTKNSSSNLDEVFLLPNKMQEAFIKNLKILVEQKATKALLLSATGTGKTYASAFAARELQSKKLLFIVHREQIAQQALNSFKKVIGKNRSYGLISGTYKDLDASFTFATMQTMSKDDSLNKFNPKHFDFIILDECHHTGAESYQKIMDYFQPKLWLGMTASPDTNQYDIYSIFDHNIACEIRLQQALEENLLCPFHYFGITDLEVNGEVFNDETSIKNFRNLISEERVNHVLSKAEYFGYSGSRVKGLVFCSRKEEAKELSDLFNKRKKPNGQNYNTIALTGANTQEERTKACKRLVEDKDNENPLDYIFTVDIFNEGVDLPEINQIILLRPTQSPVIFVQQLGRGLRRHEDKEYVVILDFIGNYTNNFMIPIALSGDRSYNKDTIRKYLREGDKVIPGSSSIHFDEISRKRIYQAIDVANFSDIKLIKQNYINLKNKLGRIPALMDFDKYGEMDVCCIFENNSLGSYYNFLRKYEKEYKIDFSKNIAKERIIEFISRKLANGKKIHELAYLKLLLSQKDSSSYKWEKEMNNQYKIAVNDFALRTTVNVLTNDFASGSNKKTFKDCVFVQESGVNEYHVSDSFQALLQDKTFKNVVEEIVDFGISRFKSEYSKTYENTGFVLYKKYTYEDVCRILNWSHNEVPLNIGGYKYDKETKTFPVFINYDKSENISATIKYEDHFISPNTLIAISKSGRSVNSEDVQNFLHAKDRAIEVHLFVRKNKDDKISKEFYYLGTMEASGKTNEFTMNNTNKSAVEIEWHLDTPVRDDIYDYIIG